LPYDDSPADALSFSGKAGAFSIDLAVLGALVYAGRIIAAGVVVYIDNLARQLVIGSALSTSLADLQSQIRFHPLLLGRPALLDVLCEELGPAAVLAWYFAFLKAQSAGLTPGLMLVRRGVWPVVNHALSSLFDLAAGRALQIIEAWLPGAGGLAALRKRVGNLSGLFAPARMLPADSRAIGAAALFLVAAATAATPLVLALSNLARVGFENAYGRVAFVAQVSVWLSLAVLATGWAAALVGACMTSPLAVAVVGPVYIFSFVFLGLTRGRAWWLALPQWILPVLAAIAPSPPRRWPLRYALLWALCALAVLHSFRLTPLHAFAAWSSWRIVPALGLLAALAAGRLQRGPAPAVRFVGLLILNAAFVAAALGAGLAPIAAGVYASLYQLAGILTLFWFLLGSKLVAAAIGLTRRLLSAAHRLCSEQSLPWLVVGVCLAELFFIGELLRFNPAFMHGLRTADQTMVRFSTLPAHQGVAIGVLLIAAVCAAAGGLTPGRARGLLALWAFSLFLIWTFFLASLALLSRAGAAAASSAAPPQALALLRGIEKRLGGEAQFVAIGLITFSLLWEAFAGAAPQQGQDALWARAPGGLILYLGLMALLAALTHFAFISATMHPQAADAYMYAGMQSLWLPMALYAGFCATAQARIGSVSRLLIGAFFVGMLAAIPVCFQRVLLGDPARIELSANLSVMAAAALIVLSSIILGVRFVPITRAIDAAAAAVAFTMGFAVAYTQALIAPLLGQFVGIVAALTGFSSALAAVRAWFAPTRWSVIPQGDLLIYYLALPAPAAAAAVVLWNAARHGRRGWAFVAAAAMLAATVIYSIPFYLNDALRMPFSPASPAPLTPVIYARALAWLTPLVAACGGYVYAAAWREAGVRNANATAQAKPADPLSLAH
jgi:hypothetical protein